jgi:hypothetical protein
MSRITTCPHCSTRLRVSEQITDKTLICPHCLADVDNPQPRFQIRAVDIGTNVKRDLSTVSIVLLVLLGLCVLGFAITFSFPRRDIVPFALMIACATLGVLVSTAIIHGLVRWGISGVRRPSPVRVIGIIFLVAVTIVASVLSSFILFLITCASLSG